MACRILVLQLESEPRPSAVKAESQLLDCQGILFLFWVCIYYRFLVCGYHEVSIYVIILGC